MIMSSIKNSLFFLCAISMMGCVNAGSFDIIEYFPKNNTVVSKRCSACVLAVVGVTTGWVLRDNAPAQTKEDFAFLAITTTSILAATSYILYTLRPEEQLERSTQIVTKIETKNKSLRQKESEFQAFCKDDRHKEINKLFKDLCKNKGCSPRELYKDLSSDCETLAYEKTRLANHFDQTQTTESSFIRRKIDDLESYSNGLRIELEGSPCYQASLNTGRADLQESKSNWMSKLFHMKEILGLPIIGIILTTFAGYFGSSLNFLPPLPPIIILPTPPQ
jgi:hypothetical protein